MGSLEYRLTDTVPLNASYGKDHKPPGETRHSLLAIGGISLGFGGLPALVR